MYYHILLFPNKKKTFKVKSTVKSRKKNQQKKKTKPTKSFPFSNKVNKASAGECTLRLVSTRHLRRSFFDLHEPPPTKPKSNNAWNQTKAEPTKKKIYGKIILKLKLSLNMKYGRSVLNCPLANHFHSVHVPANVTLVANYSPFQHLSSTAIH